MQTTIRIPFGPDRLREMSFWLLSGSPSAALAAEPAPPVVPPEPAAPCLNSAKAKAKLIKALDYLVALNDNSDNPAQKWVINEFILASLTGCFRPAINGGCLNCVAGSPHF